MTEIQWLESMQKTMAYIITHTAWEPCTAKEGLSEQGVCVLPGYGTIRLYRHADTGEEVFTEESMGALLAYTGYARYLDSQEQEETDIA
jgi:hypothetical protein